MKRRAGMGEILRSGDVAKREITLEEAIDSSDQHEKLCERTKQLLKESD
jgi:hypothetical protein